MKLLISSVIFAVALCATAFAADTTFSSPIGSKVQFSVTADGTQPFTYQWHKNQGTPAVPVDIPGATSVNYVIPAVSLADAGTYTCTVYNAVGNAVSNNAVFTVTLVPPSNVKVTISNG